MAKFHNETASVKEMGLPQETLRKLSPAAQKLTKADLLAMYDKVPAQAGAVTLEDVEVIRHAFVAQLQGRPGSAVDLGDINCCCCPCCCAVAVVKPLATVA